MRALELKIAALIAAGGLGTRVGGYPPKQFLDLRQHPVLLHTLRLFSNVVRISECMVVVPGEFRRQVEDAYASRVSIPVGTAEAGASRTQSVRNGLLALESRGISQVLIHDGVRPFASRQLIERLIDELRNCHGVAPACPVTDAIWSSDGRNAVESVSKSGLFAVQTPQAFDYAAILNAHRKFPGDAEDDIAVARRAGLRVKLIEGETSNFKITTREYFERARMQTAPEFETRTGQGFDVHRLVPGSNVILCGVKIPFRAALEGHSDADVALHSITDALYGAVAEGDIGRWFPPEDEKWKNSDSRTFLEHAAQLVAKKGYSISSVDCTIVCEFPKVAPHSAKMRQNVAFALDLDLDRVSVKATTSERLGFVGREEGIAALALATVVRR